MSNLPPLRWLILLLVAVVAVLAATALGDLTIHLVVAAVTALVLAVFGIADIRRLADGGASDHAVGAASARSMGLVWMWGALLLLLSYALLVPYWREWTHFFAAFAVVGVLCLIFAGALERDASAGSGDQTLLKLGRILTIAQCLGMLATLVGIAIDPDKSILTKIRPDWPANIVFVFGGAALLAISLYALWQQRSAPEPN